MFNKIDFKLSSPTEVAQELGRRLKTVRLSKNMRQEELAQRAGVSRLTVVHFEKTGQGSINSFLRILIALGTISELSPLFHSPPTTIAEMEKMANQKRLRASRKNGG
ncbi:MAG: helix-turn-helix transcriptional regulator [Elusimicrobia bacterium]|nr:helix-turn-helix transcriptional regulator [Elusimicrobiota bacterium]